MVWSKIMFAIYNGGSVTFRSTSDNLYSLRKVESLKKSRLQAEEGTITDFTGDKNSQNAISTYKKMAKIEEDNIYHVEDVMTKDCLYIDKSKTLNDAYNILKENKISQIPVLSDNKIDSMINKKFILNMILDDIDNGRFVLQKKLSEFFLPEVITTDPISDIRRVAKVMIDFRLDAIPVVNQYGVLVGIVSKTDIIRSLSQLTNFKVWT